MQIKQWKHCVYQKKHLLHGNIENAIWNERLLTFVYYKRESLLQGAKKVQRREFVSIMQSNH